VSRLAAPSGSFVGRQVETMAFLNSFHPETVFLPDGGVARLSKKARVPN
jgi:hypothetical protein